jgi:hypothetical protein
MLDEKADRRRKPQRETGDRDSRQVKMTFYSLTHFRHDFRTFEDGKRGKLYELSALLLFA